MFDFHNTKILVIGDIMLDKYIIGNVKRISPEAPVPIVNVVNEKVTLGGAANVANNLKGLESRPFLIGSVGADTDKNIFKSLCKSIDIEYDLLIRTTPTISKLRIIGEHQQMLRVDYEQILNLSVEEENLLIKKAQKVIDSIDVLILSDYGKGTLTEDVTSRLIKKMNLLRKIVIVDPKGKSWEKYKNATLITPNLKELSDVAGVNIDNNDSTQIYNIGKNILRDYNLKYLLVTRSEKGMMLIDKSDFYNIETHAQAIYDVSGAGDTVIATLSAAMASGLDIQTAVKLSNIAAGIVIGRVGTTSILKDELIKVIKHNNI